MKIVVLGAGVIGVTSAWYLARAGHDVTVIDRENTVAMDTSHANAGQISPGYSAPWAAPGIPLKAIRWMFMRHSPLIVGPRPDLAKLSWMARMLRNCTSERYKVNKGRMVRLAEYSRDCLIALREETGIVYDDRQKGTLQLFRTQKQVDAADKDIAVLREGGVRFELLDREGCLAAEPGLRGAAQRIAGGLRLPGDETGDCFAFTTALAELARAAGVTFRMGVSVRRLHRSGGRITAVETDEGMIEGDAFVVALGPYAPALLRPLGLRLPVYPVKGYSITLPITDAGRAPQSTVMDETYKIAITRLGDRIRAGGMAELRGFDKSLPPRREATLHHSVGDLFRGAADHSDSSFWCGLRPMTPDGTPIIGRAGADNLWLNTGHGTLGWTMATGSGKVLADLVSGRPAAIESADLGYDRYLPATARGRTRPDSLRPAHG